MKIIFSLLAAALLCGCTPKPDPRAAETAARLTEMESRLDVLDKIVERNFHHAEKIATVAQTASELATATLKVTDIDGERISQLETNVYHLK